MLRKTKIVCTLGPSTDDENVMRSLIEEGMNVARFNFSHGGHEEQFGRLTMLRKLREEMKRPVAALLDTKGPEIRLKEFASGKVELKNGQTFTLTTEDIVGDESRVAITYKDLPDDVKPGDTILIDDGLIGLEVKKIQKVSGTKADAEGKMPMDIVCTVMNGGMVSNKKGVNVPNVETMISLRHPSCAARMTCLQSARFLRKKAARTSISSRRSRTCRVCRTSMRSSASPTVSWLPVATWV